MTKLEKYLRMLTAFAICSGVIISMVVGGFVLMSNWFGGAGEAIVVFWTFFMLLVALIGASIIWDQ